MVDQAVAHSLVDLTQHEIAALRMEFNLADAHTHQHQSPTQREIVARLPELWYRAEESLQADCERDLVSSFFELHGQHSAPKNRSMLSYAASISTLVVALYLKQRDLTVSLVEPCFDNLHDLLENTGVRLSPISEDSFSDPELIYSRLAATVDTDAVFIVDPNNPTGYSLLEHRKRGFEELIRYCVDHRKLLIIDFCFASFALCDERLGRIDIYELLEASGVSYVALEDTGKTWPIQDAKCAILTSSIDVWPAMYNIHTSVLLNVSPFVLSLVREYIRDSIADGMASVRDVSSANREVIRKCMSGTILEYQEPIAPVSVAWFRINDQRITATSLHADLAGKGVYVLPGTYFYWNDPAKGERFIRIALARDPAVFARAAAAAEDLIRGYV